MSYFIKRNVLNVGSWRSKLQGFVQVTTMGDIVLLMLMIMGLALDQPRLTSPGVLTKVRWLLHLSRFLKQHQAHLIIAILYAISVVGEDT
jgi:hypothetical protein